MTATTAELASFLVAEAARGLAARTRRAEAAALRRFYDWLVRTGTAVANPATPLGTPRAAPPAPEVYQPGEVAAILAHTAGLTDLRGRERHVIVATPAVDGDALR